MGQPGGPSNPQFSPDGRWFWDGATWQPALSPDGRWRWNGYSWVRTRGDLSAGWMAAIAGGIILVFILAMVPVVLVINRLNTTTVAAVPSPMPPSHSPAHRSFTAIPCDQLEHTQVHYHAFLQILNQGSNVDIPTNVGRTLGCYYWLHMHSNEAGIIHVESPADRTFTLGDFFDVWSDWGQASQPLDSTHVSTLTLTGDQKLVVYIDQGDGKGASPFTGDPRTIVLKNHEVITLEISPPVVNPPPAFSWPPGF
ncbi:MAG TPA: hypothetical protein VGV88_04725 [Candidatus Dormibacteraeota bacterium]|nr:hypothetical protein [Candidatus Dormibacteraeota bacterium]